MRFAPINDLSQPNRAVASFRSSGAACTLRGIKLLNQGLGNVACAGLAAAFTAALAALEADDGVDAREINRQPDTSSAFATVRGIGALELVDHPICGGRGGLPVTDNTSTAHAKLGLGLLGLGLGLHVHHVHGLLDGVRNVGGVDWQCAKTYRLFRDDLAR